MIRQYGAQRYQGGSNPLRVGVVAVGTIVYLQDRQFFDAHHGGQAVCRVPWQLEGFLNGTLDAARRNPVTGHWESTFRAGRSDMAVVRSLRDRRQVRHVAVRTLIVHEDLGLTKGPARYPSLPDVARFYRSRDRPRPTRSDAPFAPRGASTFAWTGSPDITSHGSCAEREDLMTN